MVSHLESHNESPTRPPGPQKGLWSLRYLDRQKMAALGLNAARRRAQNQFSKLLPPGSDFPEIVLRTPDGERVSTGALRGHKHFVLMTGAIT